MKTIYVADLFCGGGGTSTGMIKAFEQHGIDYKLVAVNHWQKAIDTNKINHPQSKTVCASVENIKPRELVPGGRLHVLWASPECTNHSQAKGGRPKDEQSRATAWDVLKWAQELYIDCIYIENVKEFLDWGPLDTKGHPIPSKKGKTFRAYISAFEGMGYKVDWQIMNAADYGAATSRRRLIIQAVRGKSKIAWPEPTHCASPDNLFGQQPYVAAKTIIDWTIHGKSIFDRKKPLAEKTIKRIEAGIKKYWGPWAEPFLVMMRGQSKCRDINQPLPTITTVNGHSLVEPFIVKFYGNEKEAHDINNPLGTVTCKDRFAVVEGDLYYLDIRFRMLKPHELAAAMSFPPSYQFAGTSADQVKQIGNAVCPALAEALIMSRLQAWKMLPVVEDAQTECLTA